jgi:hypothetical protein
MLKAGMNRKPHTANKFREGEGGLYKLYLETKGLMILVEGKCMFDRLKRPVTQSGKVLFTGSRDMRRVGPAKRSGKRYDSCQM